MDLIGKSIKLLLYTFIKLLPVEKPSFKQKMTHRIVSRPVSLLHRAADDPALSDQSLLRKLKANREESLSRLEEVISKFAVKQEDMEEQERNKRQQKTVRGPRRVSLHVSTVSCCSGREAVTPAGTLLVLYCSH